MEEVLGASFVQGDIQDMRTQQRVHKVLGEEADVVLSDMCPPTTSDPGLNHIRTMQLANAAFNFARKLLRNGGTFCCKVFSGAEEVDFKKQLRKSFLHVKAFKPKASKSASVETYYIATGFVPDLLQHDNAPITIRADSERHSH